MAQLLSKSRRLRSTPFTPFVEAAGAKGYTVYNHMLLPTVFRTLEEDYRHLREAVQVWDVSGERQIEVVGPDAAKLIQWMTPRDLSQGIVGQCFYAPIIDERAGLINDPIVLKLAPDRFWLSIADSDVELWARALAIARGLDVNVFEAAVYPLAVQGPKAEALMTEVFGPVVQNIRFYRFAPLNFRGHTVNVARSGWSKQGGFEIYLSRASLAGALWKTLMRAGKTLDVHAGCPNLIERIESGLLSYGNDMTRANNPLECGFDRFCHHDRDFDFIGKSALQRVAKRGAKRRAMGLFIEGDALPPCLKPWPVKHEGKARGSVTSAAISPRFGCGVAIAMVDRDAWAPGTLVTVHVPNGDKRRAMVAPLPLGEEQAALTGFARGPVAGTSQPASASPVEGGEAKARQAA